MSLLSEVTKITASSLARKGLTVTTTTGQATHMLVGLLCSHRVLGKLNSTVQEELF